MKKFLRRNANYLRQKVYRKVSDYSLKRMRKSNWPKGWRFWSKVTLYCLEKLIMIDVS